MIVARTARCINESDPSIWRGRLEDGSYYEAHYRWGRLQVWTGETPRAVFGGELVLEARLPGAPPGIGYEQLEFWTDPFMSWPDEDDGSAAMWDPGPKKD